MGYKYKFNTHYFDVIDTAEKAYWLGFIWCDGSVIYRHRKNNTSEYCMKLSLSENDYHHLQKLNQAINGNYDVKFYKSCTSFKSNGMEARIAIYNLYFGKVLYYDYGMVPHRNDWSKVIERTPSKYYKDLFRGVMDADGSFSYYQAGKHKTYNKFIITFGGCEQILRFIEETLYNQKFISFKKHNLYHRHKEENRDESFRTLTLSGRNQVCNILDWLYKDATVYLDRKYQKYLWIKERSDACVKK